MRVHSAILAAAVACAAAPAAADDWPQWLGPDRNGVSWEAEWRAAFDGNGPAELWRVNVGQGYSAVAVVGERVYTLGNRRNVDTVYCLDAATGREVWKHSYDCSATIPRVLIRLYTGTRSTPTVAGGRVYGFSRDGRAWCLDAATGVRVWMTDLRAAPVKAPLPSWGFACSPLVLGKRVILDAGPIVALDAADGSVAWQSRAYPPAYASPVAFRLAGRTRLATLNGKGLTVVDAADGNEVTVYPFSFGIIENCTTPLISGGRCFISAGQRGGSALLRLGPDGPEVVWRGDAMLNLSTNSVHWRGHLYGFHGRAVGPRMLRCVELATGKRMWTARKVRDGALTIAAGRLIAITGDGELVLAEADPAAFKPLARKNVLGGTCWTTPVLANARLYCRNDAGDLVCLDVGRKEAGR